MTTHHQAAGTFVNCHPSSSIIAREESPLERRREYAPDQEMPAD
jgi:hypothetical protein